MRQAEARIVRSIWIKALPFSRASYCRYGPSSKIVLVACVHEYFILSSISTFTFTFTLNFSYDHDLAFTLAFVRVKLWLSFGFSLRGFLFNSFAENYSSGCHHNSIIWHSLHSTADIKNFTLTILQNAFSYSSFRGLNSCCSWCGGAV